MSAFSDQLSVVVGKYGSNTALAKITGINQASVSRLANGKNPPDLETIRKLCAALPDEEAADLVYAWLFDIVPAEGRHLVTIQPHKIATIENFAPSETIQRLRPQIQRAIEQLAAMSLEDPDFGNFIYDMARRMAPQFASAEATITEMPTARNPSLKVAEDPPRMVAEPAKPRED